MWRFEAGLLCYLCVATLLLQPCTLQENKSKFGQQCEDDNLGSLGTVCGPYETCKLSDKNIAKCVCLREFEYINGTCIKTATTEPPTPNTYAVKPDPELSSSAQSGGNSVAAILLIPTCLVIIGALAYFGARRYKWVQRFRQFRQNRYGSVLVTRDDTDEDDPQVA